MRLFAVLLVCAVVVLGSTESIQEELAEDEVELDDYEDDEDDGDVSQVEYEEEKTKENAINFKDEPSVTRRGHAFYHEGEEYKTDLGEEGSGGNFNSKGGQEFFQADEPPPEAESLKPGEKPSRVLVEGDIMVDKQLDPEVWKMFNLPVDVSSVEAATTKAIVTGPYKKTWPGAIIPYYIHKSKMKEEGKILSAIRQFEKATCLKFPRVTDATLKNYAGKHLVNITKGVWASSYVGRIGRPVPQTLYLHDGFIVGNLIHELMHCIGFLHEHSRNDREEYVQLEKGWDKSWNYVTAKEKKLKTDDFGVPYDYLSITHYPLTHMKQIDSNYKDIGQRRNLSVGDICQVNRLYGCHEKLDQLNLKCDCIDSYSKKSCFADKKEGLCNKDIPRMSVVCPETCGLCCQSNCTVKFSKQGCFQDAVVKNEIMKNRLHFMSGKRSEIPAENSEWVDLGSTDTKNENKRSRIVSPNIWVEWAQEGHLTKVVCTCAKKAKAAGMRYFAVRFPGECYGGKGKYYAEGISNKCRDQNFEECVYSNTKCCTGAHSGRFVYKLDQDNVLPLKRWGDVGPN